MVKKYDMAWTGKEAVMTESKDLSIHLEWVRETMDSYMHGMKF